MSPKIVLYNKLASVFLQNKTTCRFVVESPLNPQQAVDFRSSASYSHRGSLVVHEVSFPGNTFKLASTCSIVSGDVVARQKTEANDASARFFYKEACLCKRSKTPSTEKHSLASQTLSGRGSGQLASCYSGMQLAALRH